MNPWYPEIPRQLWLPTLGVTLLGAAVAGLYGAVHDQISYTVSPEYFTKLKFHQFAAANFGWPPRAFAAEVGFLGSWWVGLIAGWLLARWGVAEWARSRRWQQVATAIALLVVVAAVAGCVGAGIGVLQTQGEGLSRWHDWQTYFELEDLRAFVIVAFIHRAGYLGAVLGLVCAAVYVKVSGRWRSRAA